MSEYIVEAETREDLVDGHWYGGEELVRCGECKWYEEENHNCLDEMGFARIWEPTDYCSFGERKDDASHPFADDVMMGEREDRCVNT